ncbi:MAG: asparagine synthase (glutamine-hydrolyzing) [Proteobacteria bacterium]|nr:asparagine synthase (glutamine-hydrolyzing) [Pseudomonadota bacterium]
MCGIAVWLGAEDGTDILSGVHRMMAAMSHRGPDDEGVYIDPEGLPLAFGHRRLAVIDPERGVQPMTTADGQVTVVFNGAIYNYLELRRELIARGHRIETYSDTEVILHAYTEWGEACLERFNGMFAFGLWDRRRRRLFAARDRIGIKPLYYYTDGHRLVLASEIKAILATGLIEPELDPRGLADYLTFQYTLGAKTMFRGINKVEPGCSLTAGLVRDRIELSTARWWDLDFTVDPEPSESYLVDQLKFLIEDSIRLRLRSDVPLGAHLSGGLDSSTVVTVASRLLGVGPLKTFTGAFEGGPAYDETRFAKMVARAAGTEYHEVYPTAEDFVARLPYLVYMMDEPAGGPGLFPQYMVSRLAAGQVKVVLGGQGGDELFLGYARYLVAYLEACLNGAIFSSADPSRHAATLQSIIPNLPLLRSYRPLLQHFWRQGLFEDFDRRYFRLVDRRGDRPDLIDPAALDPAYDPFEHFRELFNRPPIESLINRIASYELRASLPALLQVEDRTSMAVGLESRVPLLDHRLVELMGTIPPVIKFKGGRTKHLFLEAIRHLLPAEVLGRQDKMGFPVPLGEWAAGPARPFIESVLLGPAAQKRGVFNINEIERALSAEQPFGRVVWGLLNLELWFRAYFDGEVPSQG